MNKFSLIEESQSNIYQLGTPFSNGHRSRKNGDGFLLDRHLMIDIDEFIYAPDGSIFGVVENKKQQPGPDSRLRNIITERTSQKSALLELCKQLRCHLFVFIENEKKYYYFKNETPLKIYTQEEFQKGFTEKNLLRQKTDNKIFIEFRIEYNKVQLKSIDLRNDNQFFQLASSISSKLNIPLVEVNDEGDTIKFRCNGRFIDEVPSVLKPENKIGDFRRILEDEWESIYKKMNLFD